MATSILIPAFPVGTATRTCERQLGRPSSCRATPLATIYGNNWAPLSALCKKSIVSGCGLRLSSRGILGFSQGRRGVVAQAQEKDEGGPQVGDAKPFYAALEFWIQAAVVILTLGFVDAGYSGDWSRIGALSQEAEAQLREAAYVVVPFSAALVWAIGNRKRTP